MKTKTLNHSAKQAALADMKANRQVNEIPQYLVVRKPSYLVVPPLDVVTLDSLLDVI
jgi:hypothetical protein